MLLPSDKIFKPFISGFLVMIKAVILFIFGEEGIELLVGFLNFLFCLLDLFD
jgi:hypothetical protein